MSRRYFRGGESLKHGFAAVLFLIGSCLIGYDSIRQKLPPIESLQVVNRDGIAGVYIGENFGIPTIRHEYVAIELHDGSLRRYREWYPRYAEVREAAMSLQPIRIWIAPEDHYKLIYQVESAGRIVVDYADVGARIKRNADLIGLMAFGMGFLIFPYLLWKAWRADRARCD
jgi:hypothetical protein